MQNKRKNMVPAGVPEQAGTPEQTAADLPLTDSNEQLYTVTVDGQTVELTLPRTGRRGTAGRQCLSGISG